MNRSVKQMSARMRWVVLLSCMAVALVVAAMAALYTALPHIATETGATQGQLTWIIDGYTLALACLVLPAGALGDRFGRRLMLFGGLTVFTVASIVPLAVHGPVWLIAARAVAGAGAAFVMPSTLSILTAGLPRERRNVAVGIWAGTVGVGAIVGILGSGLLLTRFSWESIMIAMAAIGGVLTIATGTVPESRDSSRPSFDPWGALSGAGAVALAVIAALEAPQHGWTAPIVIGTAIGAVVVGAGFAVIELRVAHPLLDVRLLAQRGFGTGTASVALQFMVSFGLFMLIVQYMQLILGYSPLMSAVAMAPMIVPMVALSVVSPWLAERYGLRWPMGCGLAIVGIGLLTLGHLDTHSTFIDLLWPLLIMSTGLGLSSAPATAAIVNGAPPDKHGVAAAVNDAAREVGAAIGIALAGSILAAGYSNRIASVIPLVPEQIRGPVSGSLAGALEVTERIGPQARPLADMAEAAFVHGLHQATTALGAATVVVAVVLGAWAPGRKPRPAPETAKAEVAAGVD
ncbi:MFS transporter [Nocardia miyunensis]|uniref:MFS transporter n=1 Tax=Nocardia miyunensis TaxID=282684 RepID=UPI000AB01AE5|nr:MFS transporter [Nocardia miyunensis]